MIIDRAETHCSVQHRGVACALPGIRHADRVSRRLVADLAPGGASSFAQLLGGIGDTLIGSADAGNLGSGTTNVRRQAYAVNRHDGTRVQLTQFPVGQHLVPERLSRETEFPGHVVMRHNDGMLRATDGTLSETQRLNAPGGPGHAGAGAVCALPAPYRVPAQHDEFDAAVDQQRPRVGHFRPRVRVAPRVSCRGR
ncbi:hypothetical protein [Tahibacter sp.]|uniref:hypothetical protein n=1 Tax=Tahibacter sp. TaxID=2056211 RepID=UPI0028C3A4C8|nr:hypothetical protein [Tahibacter sp.]